MTCDHGVAIVVQEAGKCGTGRVGAVDVVRRMNAVTAVTGLPDIANPTHLYPVCHIWGPPWLPRIITN
jgi:hypothetical protein